MNQSFTMLQVEQVELTKPWDAIKQAGAQVHVVSFSAAIEEIAQGKHAEQTV